MKGKIKVFAVLSILIMAFVFPTSVNAASLNKKNLTISKGEKYALVLKENTKKVKWKSSNKGIATVSKAGVVKGQRIGSCTITASVGKKKYKCNVKVKEFNISRYLTTVNISYRNLLNYFKINVRSDPHFAWINKDYYCYDVKDDDFDFSYNVIYKYKDIMGETRDGWSLGCWLSSPRDEYGVLHQVEHRAEVHENGYNIQIRTPDFCTSSGKLVLLKRSAVKKVISRKKVVLLNNKKITLYFPLG